MFFFFDSMQAIFAGCTASKSDFFYFSAKKKITPILIKNVFVAFFFVSSYCQYCFGISASANVPVFYAAMHQQWRP